MGCGHRSPTGPPYAPDQALKTFQLEKGFRIELFAAEPLVASPVAMEFDEQGRIFVVEMPGYPLDTGGSGRVVLLEDTDGDGRPDRRTVFADKLVMPNGVMRWKKGILVSDPPNVWYFEDSDGDNRADVRRVVLTGFAFTNPQHRANGLLYGLDNWIYLANEPAVTAVVFKEKFGDRGSALRFSDRSTVPALEVQGRNVRFRPDTYQLEALSGNSQFGHTFDEWGHHFTLDNSNHVRHEVVGARYLKRNPDLLVPTSMQNMSDHGNAAEVFPITRNPQHQMLTDVGRITSACGLTLYLGGAFPAGFERASFVAEPAHNLVHRDVWSASGPTFVAKRAQEGVEFLASMDSWFRPVNFYIGPDGALYLLDFYRQIIEHPEWMARAVYESQAIYHGVDRGRIYRIVPDAATPARPKGIHLGDASDDELVQHLGHPNIWWRRAAQRLLMDRQSATAVDPLVRLFKERRSPLARVHALWTLEGLGKLDARLIEMALEDSEPGIRENAIRLAEPRLTTAPALVEKLLPMAADPDAQVRFQLLCTLGDLDSAPARAVWEKLLFENIEDDWMRLAALSAPSERALGIFETARSRLAGEPTHGRTLFFRQVSSMIAARQQADEIRQVVQSVARVPSAKSAWWRAASLEGLAQGVQGKKTSAATLKVGQPLLLRLLDSSTASVRRATLQLLEAVGLTLDPSAQRVLNRAAITASDRQADAQARADAIRLLNLTDTSPHAALLRRLVDPQEPEQVQAAAVRALGRIKGDEIAWFLLKKWKAMTSPVRMEAADALFLGPERIRLMFNAIKSGEVSPWMLGARHRRRLIMNEDPVLREQARALLAENSVDRKKVVEHYAAALTREGNAARGAEVFKNICVKCHQMNGAGGKLGPDLATVRNRTPEALLTDILIPSQSIAQNYETYVIELAGGGIKEGVIGAETPTTITLRHEDGTEEIIARASIEDMYVSNISAMPEDLDKQIDVPAMADLLKFLKTAR
jgi:putative membrane-bound dehydrogenase-like protein